MHKTKIIVYIAETMSVTSSLEAEPRLKCTETSIRYITYYIPLSPQRPFAKTVFHLSKNSQIPE